MSITWRRKALGEATLYEQLGVKPLINAKGDPTLIGGSTIGPAVQAAMEEANEYFVDMVDLMRKSGEEIARIIGCPAAMMTSGCFAALVLGSAGIMTGKDPDKIASLPDTTSMKNEFLIMKAMRYHYDRYPSVVGGKLVEVGDQRDVAIPQLEAAVGPRTAAIMYLARYERDKPHLPKLPQVLEMAKRKKVPVIVDAAGEVYPLDRMRWLANCGADAVCFGTKYIGSHHSTGIIAGSKSAVEAAFLNGFVAFESADNHCIGRGYKVDRQEIVGTVVALRQWFTMDHEERLAFYDETIALIERALADVPGLAFDRVQDAFTRRLQITVDHKLLEKSVAQIAQALKDGEPSILVRTGAGMASNQFQVQVSHLRPGEPEIVINRIREILA